jgi:hypothetical protein
MPRRELKSGKQVADWLAELSASLARPGAMTLIGSAALLWHAHDRGLPAELPEASMDVDPVTDSDEIAARCYEALIGSEFERIHGWHINLMPESVLQGLPPGWEQRATVRTTGRLRLTIPAAADLLAPKLRRNEPGDRAHAEWPDAADCSTEKERHTNTVFINGIYFQEYAKLEYGRMLWRHPASRDRLLRHWRDPRHPHAERFAAHEAEVCRVLESPKGSDETLDAELRQRGLSLRVVVKEIPSVFGSFY